MIGFYFWNLKVNNEKNDNSIFQDDNTSNIVDGDYTINVESNDINNTFRSLLEKNGIIYYDIQRWKISNKACILIFGILFLFFGGLWITQKITMDQITKRRLFNSR